jgi:uncharacterized protein
MRIDDGRGVEERADCDLFSVALGGRFAREGFVFYFSEKTFGYVAVPSDDRDLVRDLDALFGIEDGTTSAPGAGKQRVCEPRALFQDEVIDLLVDKGLLSRPGAPAEPAGGAAPCGGCSQGAQIGLALLLNQYCNLSCVYCLDGRNTYESENFPRMPESTIEVSLDKFIRRLPADGTLNVNLLGGEPTLTWSACQAALRIGRDIASRLDRRISFSVQSNLTHLPDDFIADCKKYGIRVIANVDGAPDVHNKTRPMKGLNNNSYERTLANLRELRRHGIPFDLRATLTSANAGDLVALARLHQELGAVDSMFGLLRPTNSDREIFPSSLYPGYEVLWNSFADLYARSFNAGNALKSLVASRMKTAQSGFAFCGAVDGSIATVDFKGNLYTCPWFVGNPSLCIGNVFREPMYDAGKVLDVGRKQVVSEESACRGCGYRRACGGGCSVTRVLAGQTTAGADGTLAERARLFQCAQVKPAVQQLIFEDFERAVGGRVRTRHTHESVAGSPR